jgi:hypothetical protein
MQQKRDIDLTWIPWTSKAETEIHSMRIYATHNVHHITRIRFNKSTHANSGASGWGFDSNDQNFCDTFHSCRYSSHNVFNSSTRLHTIYQQKTKFPSPNVSSWLYSQTQKNEFQFSLNMASLYSPSVFFVLAQHCLQVSQPVYQLCKFDNKHLTNSSHILCKHLRSPFSKL